MTSDTHAVHPQTALFALSLASAIGYGLTTRAAPSIPRMLVKTASIGTLAVISTRIAAPRPLIAAQAFGALGDAFLAWDGEAPFLCGLASFLTAHIFYIGLFARTGLGSHLILSEGWRVGTALAMLVVALGMVVMLLPRVARDLRVPIVVYSVAIYAMVLAALSIDNARLVTGAILFTASDSLLATGKFLLSRESPHRMWIEYAVWALYYGGQVLIMNGLLETL
ncbi:YhhN-like protein [Plectosphaerella cucumerina]|uniref:YhhN-like protein n=1 Tax=Plectosphaerella cucumerina TaxID=40658 RepID=A0A8K0T4V1_9PEZI|nr:YhhN-like protein [Plectosphaerella cucumerina]